MVNRVKTARNIARELDQVSPILITGRLRPMDRDDLIAQCEPALKAGSKVELTNAVVVVTTQCLEVGADFSFDTLITECASLDAMRQRFGRLARLGTPSDASGVILIRKRDIEPKERDPIYADALPKTWSWLNSNVDGPSMIHMGIGALDPKLPSDLSPYRAPNRNAPVLLPAYVDILCQTSPRPAIEPDIALFLHGMPEEDERPQVQARVVWRDLPASASGKPIPPLEEIVAEMVPLNAEMLTLPLTELRKILDAKKEVIDVNDADIEGAFEAVAAKDKPSTGEQKRSTIRHKPRPARTRDDKQCPPHPAQ